MNIDVWWIRVDAEQRPPRDRAARASARRAAVRILKDASGIDPVDPRTGAPRWETGPHGKPGPLADYHWNLTHGRGWAAVAIADRPVGIDLVHDESLIRPEAVCARYFALREAAGLDRGGIAAALARKEALAKALGARLLDLLATDVTADTIMSADLGESAIPQPDTDSPAIRRSDLPVAGIPAVPSDTDIADMIVRLTDLPAPPGHTAALAAVASSPSAQFHLRQHVWRSTCDSPQPRPPRSAGRRAASTPS